MLSFGLLSEGRQTEPDRLVNILTDYGLNVRDLIIKKKTMTSGCRSQWPRGLKRRSAAARLLRSWFRIPPGHGYLSVVSVVCCQVEVSATS